MAAARLRLRSIQRQDRGRGPSARSALGASTRPRPGHHLVAGPRALELDQNGGSLSPVAALPAGGAAPHGSSEAPAGVSPTREPPWPPLPPLRATLLTFAVA